MTPSSGNLARHARRASLWSAADSLLRAVLGFVITVALARMVAPAEFGVIAMILVFSAIANVLVDSGLGTALIQRQDVGHVEESTAFHFNMGMSVVLAVVMVVAAPWIAYFFEQPILIGIARLMALNLVVGALGAIHTTLLAKELNFRPLVLISLCSMLPSGALAIFLAWSGYGTWSLAWQVLAQTSISTLLLWTWHRWRPLPVFDRVALSRLFNFGGHVMAAALLDAVYTRLYSVFIGKLFSASDLGFYTRAQSTQQMPTTLLANMLNRVALPAFSRAASDQVTLRAALAKASRLLMFVNLPLMAGMAITAQPLVLALFGARWLPAVRLLQVLCVFGALWPLQVLNVSALLAQGQAQLVLRIEFVKKAFGVLALVATSPYGLLAIVWGQAATAIVAFAVNSFYSGRLLGFGALAQVRALARNIAATAAMLAILWLVQRQLQLSSAFLLAVLVPLGVFSYVVASVVLGVSQLREIIQQFRSGTT